MSDPTHQDRILDQFTRQATPFSTASPITDANALRMIVEAAAPKATDTVLDVACGGGIIVCAFAPHVAHATGIDMTPAMLERAQQLAAEKLRDPSHVRCLTLPELKALFGTAGLPGPSASFYELRDEIRNPAARSFPKPGDDVKIIAMLAASAEDDRLGIPVRRVGERLEYAYPVAILAAPR